ncbi:MAG: hypothetical protein OEZ34_09095 [Spirochaetia bacterium]|nr:hypothetical protein [Spirochaetia bacterium]
MISESSNSRKGKKKFIWYLIFLFIAGGIGYSGYLYGPGLYYRFTGDAILRVRKRTASYEDFLRNKNKSVVDLYTYIIDSRKLQSIILKDDPLDAELYYHQGLFEFYELILRTQLNSTSLIQLTGRGYLPEELKFPDIPQGRVREIAERASFLMRKSQAIDPDMGEDKLALSNLIIIYSDLLHTGRTDPHLLSRLEKIKPELIKDPYRAYDLWIRFALYIIMGKSAEMELLLVSLENQEISQIPLGSGSPITSEEKNILVSHLYFYTGNYIKSLISARNVKFLPGVDRSLKIEAVRMEAEIFLKQRGPIVARYFFEEALALSEGKDTFIKDRISSLDLE